MGRTYLKCFPLARRRTTTINSGAMRRSAALVMATLAGCAMAAHEATPTDSADPGNSGSDMGSGSGSGHGSGSGSGSGSNTTPPPAHVPLLLSEVSLGPAGHE